MSEAAAVMIFSHDPNGDAAFLGDVLGLRCAAAGGWILVTLPSGVLEEDSSDLDALHQLFVTGPDIEGTMAALRRAGVAPTVETGSRGPTMSFALPGGAMVRFRERPRGF
ncbi:MAG: hypothetical protein JO013_16725 [Alphaproteobacteria bacterium]|nr:hypothetical protein [Alphaproteobacteria bacterium]